MVLFEVERKFIFLPALVPMFKLNKGLPPFKHLKYQGTSTFRDTYYDSSEILSNRGIWIRKRDKGWEAKKRVQGDFLKTSYEEIKSPLKIRSLVSENLPGIPTNNENFGLDIFCDFTTKRELYLADEKFSIMLDEADFGHTVGEVELLASNINVAEFDIDEFMKKYSWFFKNGKPKGKITAYLEKYGPGARVH